MKSEPAPPYLVIRSGRSFWVEHRPPGSCAARLQAFRAGCFDEAHCYDESGRLWPIVGARLKRSPSFLERLLPSRWVPVELELGPAQPAAIEDVVARLASVLRSG